MSGVIPTLFINQMELTEQEDIIAYLIKFLLNNPGWTSSQLESSLLSMRKFIAESAEDKSILPGLVKSVLDDAVKKYYPEYSAEVTTEQITDVRYNLTITVIDELGATVLTVDDFVIDNGVFKLKSEIIGR